jgi:ABC-type glycerol-3-phosphate transport system substrate-binding protein
MKMNKLGKLFVLSCALAVIVSGCGKTDSNKIDSGNVPEVEQTNDSLKICITKQDASIYAEKTISKFRSKYPEVNVEVQTIEDDQTDEQSKKLETELMSGTGADIYIDIDNYLEDPYKIQRAGALENLMPWFEKTENFSVDDYVKGTFDLYEDTDECYVMPSMMFFDALSIPKKIQTELGFDAETWKTTADIESAIWKFYEKYPDEMAFTSASPFGIMPYGMGFRIWKENTDIFDGADFRAMAEIYKRQVYPYGESIMHHDREKSLKEDEDIIQGKRPCMGLQFFALDLDSYIRMGGEENVTISPVWTPDGGISTICYFQNVIAAASPNKENAFHFLQMLLDDMANDGLPGSVRKSANEAGVQQLRKRYEAETVVIDKEVYPGLTSKTFDQIEEYYNDAEIYFSGSIDFVNHYESCMEPFYEGKGSYEESVADFKKYLEIYYSE